MSAAPDPVIPDEKLARYDSLLRRAQDKASVSTERDVALREMRRMEEAYPGLQMVYLAQKLAEQAVGQAGRDFGPEGKRAAQAAGQTAWDMYKQGVGWNEAVERLGAFANQYIEEAAREGARELFRVAEEGLAQIFAEEKEEDKEEVTPMTHRPNPRVRAPKIDDAYWEGPELDRLLECHVDVNEVELLEDDDGYRVLVIRWEVPVPLVERCRKKAKEAQALLAWLLEEVQAILEEPEGTDKDEDD